MERRADLQAKKGQDNEATLITTLAGPWSLRLANIRGHDSDPAEDVKKDDSKTSVNLQYSF